MRNQNFLRLSVTLGVFLLLLMPHLLFCQNTPCPTSTICTPTVACPWVCDPLPITPINPSITPGDCYGLNNYLSRSEDLQDLQDYILDSPGLRDGTECDGPDYNVNINSDYCPCNYAKLIKTLVDLDITFVQKAYSGAGYHIFDFFQGEQWFDNGSRVVRDINRAFDCAGKPRPVIQSFFDIFDGEQFDIAENRYNENQTINRHIPAWVIQRYFEIFPEDLGKNNLEPIESPSDFDINHDNIVTYEEYYFDENNTPRSNLFFKRNRIFVGNSFSFGLLEMRMYCLYVTFSEIEMGYTSIHMSIYYAYANPVQNDPGYAALIKLTQAMRSFASLRNQVLFLSGETPMYLNEGGGQSAHYFLPGDNTPHFIFDFDSRAMRPREFSIVYGNPPAVTASIGDGQNCVNEIDPNFITELSDPTCPCHGYQQLAVIDPCTTESFGGAIGGYNPAGCYIQQQPYTIHFDGFTNPVNPDVPSDGPASLAYGYHDHQWFSMLSEQCRSWWFNYFFCNLRQFLNNSGSIVIPGIIKHDIDLSNPGMEDAKGVVPI